MCFQQTAFDVMFRLLMLNIRYDTLVDCIPNIRFKKIRRSLTFIFYQLNLVRSSLD